MLKGRIIKALAGFYYVDVPKSGIYQCRAKGIFRKDKMTPMVGDIVGITITDPKDMEGNVETIDERRSVLQRPMVANVDGALVIFALKDPDPNRYLLDRFLVMMEREALHVTICFNKNDITEDALATKLSDIYTACGYTVILTSTKTGEGIGQIKELLSGRLTTVAGPSGAGKSSIINCLQDDVVMETGEVSKKIGRGKQTTRHTQLIAIAEDSYIIDTPGFGTFDLPQMEPQELELFFPEMEKYRGKCRFRGCAHMDEPGCAIKEAVDEEQISGDRYESYRQIYRELYAQSRQY